MSAEKRQQASRDSVALAKMLEDQKTKVSNRNETSKKKPLTPDEVSRASHP
jgi:hypothetical protein